LNGNSDLSGTVAGLPWPKTFNKSGYWVKTDVANPVDAVCLRLS